MARKYVNYRVGGSPQKETDDYSVWTNDLLNKIIASKTTKVAIVWPKADTVANSRWIKAVYDSNWAIATNNPLPTANLHLSIR